MTLFVAVVEKFGSVGWSDCVRLCLMRDSTLAFFVLKSVITEFELSFQKLYYFLFS